MLCDIIIPIFAGFNTFIIPGAVTYFYEVFDNRQNIFSVLVCITDEDIIFVFGSLYLASTLREKIKNFFRCAQNAK